MKFSALVALVGAASAGGTCTWDLNVFTDGTPCTGNAENVGSF